MTLLARFFVQPKTAAVEAIERQNWRGGWMVFALSFALACLFHVCLPESFEAQVYEKLHPHRFLYWLRMLAVSGSAELLDALLLWTLLKCARSAIRPLEVVVFAAWLHVYDLAARGLMILAACLDLAWFFKASETALSLWGAAAAIVGISRIAGTSILRSLFLMSVSAAGVVGLFYFLFVRGIISAATLDALIFR